MNENINTLMDEQIEGLLEKLKNSNPGSAEYLEALSALERLTEMRLDSEKLELEYTEKRETRVFNNGRADEELRLKEAEELRAQEAQSRQKKEFWIKLGVDVGSVLLSGLFFAFQWSKGYEFEKNGTYTSSTFKEMRQKAFANMFKRK